MGILFFFQVNYDDVPSQLLFTVLVHIMGVTNN